MPVISVRVDRRTYEALVKLAEARGVSLYSFVKALLEAQVSSEVSGEVSSQVSCQVSSEVSYRELERKLSELTSKVSYLEEKIQELLTSVTSKTVATGDVTASSGNPQATQSMVKPGERKRVIVFTLEWAKRKGISIQEYMSKKEREGYLCNDTGSKVACVWREDVEQLVVDLNSANAKLNDLDKVLSGERLETAKVAVEAGLLWYDNREKRWRAPL